MEEPPIRDAVTYKWFWQGHDWEERDLEVAEKLTGAGRTVDAGRTVEERPFRAA
jgi:hypothetical protein